MRRTPKVRNDQPEPLRGHRSLRAPFARVRNVVPEFFVGLPVTWIAMALSSLTGLIVPVVIRRAIDDGGLSSAASSEPNQISTPDLGSGGAPTVDVGYIVQLTVVAVAALTVGSILRWWARIRISRRAQRALAGMRIRLLDNIHRLSISQQRDRHSGEFVARLTSDVDALESFASWGAMAWLFEPLLIAAILASILFFSPALGAIVLIAMIIALVALSRLIPGMNRAYDATRISVADTTQAFTEVIGGAETIRAYRAQRWATSVVRSAANRQYDRRVSANRYGAIAFSAGDLVTIIALSPALFVGIAWHEQLHLSAGTIIAIVSMTLLLFNPIGFLLETADSAQSALSAFKRIADLSATEPTIIEPDPGQVLPSGALGVEATKICFAYPGGPQVLHNVSLSIAAGERIAIVGETGSGKSTFAHLLCRLIDPSGGELAIGGVPMPEISPPARLSSIRFVPQDGYLFDTTLRENIGFGRPGITDVEIDDAVHDLGLDDWVAGLPEGLEMQAGERGNNLSAGERQLVSFIRAAVADPGLLILDEATSTVDPLHDLHLTSALDRLAQDRTVVSIAHRLSTSQRADRIVVFDGGRIVEIGTHTELLDRAGPYVALHEAWSTNTSGDP